MTNSFQPLPHDCIDYYPLSQDRVVALSKLDVRHMDLADYLGLNLPFAIGQLKPEFIAAFPFTTTVETAKRALATHVINGFADASDEDIAQSVTTLNDSNVSIARIACEAIHRSMLNFDRQLVGGKTVRVNVDTDDHPISPERLKAPIWHQDHTPNQTLATEEGHLLPQQLSPVVRGYAVRIVPAGTTENVQPEYVMDAELLKDGKPHPLIVEMLQVANRAMLYRQGFKVLTSQINQALETNPEFAKGWAGFMAEQTVVESKMRDAGLVRQAKPGEVLMASNYTYHVTHRPEISTPSTFVGMQVMKS